MSKRLEKEAQAIVEARRQAASESGETIEKVRDLLFGAQMRALDDRINILENRLLVEMSDLRGEVGKRMESVEEAVKKEFRELGDRIEAERDSRIEASAQLQNGVRENAEALEDRTGLLGSRVEEVAKDIREEIAAETESITNRMTAKHKDAMRAVRELAERIRSDYVERANLSQTLTEAADKLNAEPDDPEQVKAKGRGDD